MPKKESLLNQRGQGGGQPKRLSPSQQQDQLHWSSGQLGALLQERYGIFYSKGYLPVVLPALGLK